MALRRFSSNAAKRLVFCVGHQKFVYSNVLGTPLEKQLSLLPKEFGSQSRNFRCISPHLYAAATFSRTALLSSPAEGSAERRVTRKKAKDIVDTPTVKERPVIFECRECEALCLKRVQKEPFEIGVVMVRCLECRSVNLVADNLGLFTEKGSMKKFLFERGVDPRFGDEGSYELLVEDLVKLAKMEAQEEHVQPLEQSEQKGEEQQQQAFSG
ncbi:hypothetical protein R1sor_019754 [Riccia sorocarpa]|uniref:DNL-type domain-containing protein n=1 Tax=Riccia sorocarpa TaxID=122646 RepID=A0ABD3IDJ5_9MARC